MKKKESLWSLWNYFWCFFNLVFLFVGAWRGWNPGALVINATCAILHGVFELDDKLRRMAK